MKAIEERKIDRWDYDGRLFNFRPCLFVFLFLCLGIFYAYCALAYQASPWWSLLLIPVFAASVWILRRKIACVAVWFLALAFTIGGVSFYARGRDYLSSPVLYGDCGVRGEVVFTRQGDGYLELVLKEIEVDGVAYEYRLNAYVVGVKLGEIKIGDEIFLEGRISTFDDLRDEGFAGRLAENARYRLTCESGAQILRSNFRPFALVRERLRTILTAGMDEDTASLVFAITTGDSSLIENGLLENVRAGGIAHIFAVSGLHIGTLYSACNFLAERVRALKKRKIFRALAVLSVLVFYGGICGFSESVVRAIIGCAVAEAYRLSGLKRDACETLSTAGIAILLANPISLFCVGFQLSFAACFGIALLARPMQVRAERLYRRLFAERLTEEEKLLSVAFLSGTRGKLISFLSVTVSAQLATAPILYASYGYLSFWGTLLNCIFVPCVGAIYPITLGFCVVASVLPIALSKIILFLPNLVWTTFALVFQTFDFTFVITGGEISLGVILCYYCAVLLLSDKFNLSRDKKLVAFAVFSATCLLGVIL